MFICHGNGWLFLQSGNLGAGELWFIIPTINKGFFTIRCFGSEKGLGLENREGQLQMMCNYGDPSEMWLVEKHHSPYTVSCYNGDKRQYLSHGCGWLFLQDGCLGAGELRELSECGVAG